MLTLRDMMTPDPVTLEPDMSLRDAIVRLTDEGISGAPVVSGRRLVGVVSATDILEFQSSNPGVPAYREEQREWGELGPADQWEEDVTDPPAAYFSEMWPDAGADVVERMAESEGPEWDALGEHVVGEVMTRKVLALSPEASPVEAAKLMIERQIHRLIVAEDHTLLGIVSTMDFVRAVAEESLGAME